jgi:hypothetical protein
MNEGMNQQKRKNWLDLVNFIGRRMMGVLLLVS